MKKTDKEKYIPTLRITNTEFIDSNGNVIALRRSRTPDAIINRRIDHDEKILLCVVNSHEELIKIAKEEHGYYISDYETSANPHVESKCKVCRAIAKAEGK